MTHISIDVSGLDEASLLNLAETFQTLAGSEIDTRPAHAAFLGAISDALLDELKRQRQERPDAEAIDWLEASIDDPLGDELRFGDSQDFRRPSDPQPEDPGDVGDDR